ncbi:YchJ family protein [Rhodococcus sp. CX]|uniref:YchJ family protein n=1 Tax=Rhodococcus sp. CX TaxID=2789880 RepID=UPI0018CDC8F9|nr:YchJ family protein [Rhodococcus sp. CX]MBH0121834.1 YchJ family protein [Rhodococcus sp. CX]
MGVVNRRRTRVPAADSPCPCGRGVPFGECCGPLLDGADAPTAERLMRSRYTAFAVGNAEYLERTWHPSARPTRLELDPDQRWTGLEVLRTTGGGFLHTEGTVEFRAHYTYNGVEDTLHEHSRFVREDGRWLYLDALP